MLIIHDRNLHSFSLFHSCVCAFLWFCCWRGNLQLRNAQQRMYTKTFNARATIALLSVANAFESLTKSKKTFDFLYFLAHCLKDKIKGISVVFLFRSEHSFQILAHIAVIIFLFIALDLGNVCGAFVFSLSAIFSQRLENLTMGLFAGLVEFVGLQETNLIPLWISTKQMNEPW